jgi:hypothetical protein
MTAITRRQLLAWCLVAFALGSMTGYAATNGYLHGRTAAQGKP